MPRGNFVGHFQSRRHLDNLSWSLTEPCAPLQLPCCLSGSLHPTTMRCRYLQLMICGEITSASGILRARCAASICGVRRLADVSRRAPVDPSLTPSVGSVIVPAAGEGGRTDGGLYTRQGCGAVVEPVRLRLRLRPHTPFYIFR